MSAISFRSLLPIASLSSSNLIPEKSLPISLRMWSVHRSRTFALIFLGLLPVILTVGCASSPPISVTLSSSSSQSLQQGNNISISATVANDISNKGVTWSLSGSTCSGAACGSLTSQSTTSVTYNAPTSIPSDIAVTLTATSVANPSKFASTVITVPASVVAIENKVTKLAAGTANYLFARFNATVQNEPTSAGVTWTLTANGTPCSPACGTLSTPSPYEVNYAPPASVPAAPNNMPTITATSVYSPARSDADPFTIFDGSAACGAGGNESLLNGQYAIMLQGWSGTIVGSPILYAASFSADGTGKITGGQDQFNPYFANMAYAGAAVIPSGSSYSVGPDNRGCLTLTDNNENTFSLRFSLGGISGGIASKGDVIFVNEQSATPERASGILRRQDPTAFSLSALASNYAFGVDGWNNSSGTLNHFALAGFFTQSGGTASSLAFDQNDGGKMLTTEGTPESFNFITIQDPVSTGTGMAMASMFLPGTSSLVEVQVYVINSSELFFVALILSPEGPEFSGQAIATSSSFSASSVSPNYIFHFTGSSSETPSSSIGLASFSSASSPGISGTVSGSMDEYSGGTASTQSLTGTYALAGLSGRLDITGATVSTSPTCYLTNPFDGVSAFCISTDSTASFGIFDTQPAATYNSSSLSGNFFFGSGEPANDTVSDLSGVALISSGNLQGVQDASAQSGFSLASPFTAILSINADGSGNLGPNTVAVTNGTALYFIDESGKIPALVQVLAQ
jgi:hypothetical protein